MSHIQIGQKQSVIKDYLIKIIPIEEFAGVFLGILTMAFPLFIKPDSEYVFLAYIWMFILMIIGIFSIIKHHAKACRYFITRNSLIICTKKWDQTTAHINKVIPISNTESVLLQQSNWLVRLLHTGIITITLKDGNSFTIKGFSRAPRFKKVMDAVMNNRTV